ncbi:hypothetical protein BACERE00183_04670 [Bacillus cereus]|nr:hypothetical protein BACERE00183_04670 [Bacillus cereus]
MKIKPNLLIWLFLHTLQSYEDNFQRGEIENGTVRWSKEIKTTK